MIAQASKKMRHIGFEFDDVPWKCILNFLYHLLSFLYLLLSFLCLIPQAYPKHLRVATLHPLISENGPAKGCFANTRQPDNTDCLEGFIPKSTFEKHYFKRHLIFLKTTHSGCRLISLFNIFFSDELPSPGLFGVTSPFEPAGGAAPAVADPFCFLSLFLKKPKDFPLLLFSWDGKLSWYLSYRVFPWFSGSAAIFYLSNSKLLQS
ncbi:hypothetical protein V6Z12_D12G235700 [Gossypium hirsutum]